MILNLITLFGGIAIFIYGLTSISQNTERLASKNLTKKIDRLIKNPFCGLAVGTVFAGITQSSVAVSVITVSLVEVGAVSFRSAAAVIMGANIGTTVTAQLISSSSSVGSIVGSISAIIGLLLGFFKNKRIKTTGDAIMGLGFLFAGLSIMSRSVTKLAESKLFASVFLIENPFLLFLNGTVITAITQSSSVITGIMVILANSGIVTFQSSAFLTLGSNVGSCFAVAISSMGKSVEARRSAIFNIIFNLLGSLIFFPFLFFFGEEITGIFIFGGKSLGKAVANFHTAFNLVCTVVAMPMLNLLVGLVKLIVSDKRKKIPKRPLKRQNLKIS